jgi:hypothetical protein
MPKIFLGVILFAGICGCQQNKPKSRDYFDSLVNSNIYYLVKHKASLNKATLVNKKNDTLTFIPDSSSWSQELDVFRQLNVFEKPAYRNAYSIANGLKDSQSNLSIQEYKSSGNVPIPLLRFYYYQQLKNLKRIEARYYETNTLYSGTRHLIMDFQEKGGKPILFHYSINGLQRLILSDSVTYSIQATINF